MHGSALTYDDYGVLLSHSYEKVRHKSVEHKILQEDKKTSQILSMFLEDVLCKRRLFLLVRHSCNHINFSHYVF